MILWMPLIWNKFLGGEVVYGSVYSRQTPCIWDKLLRLTHALNKYHAWALNKWSLWWQIVVQLIYITNLVSSPFHQYKLSVFSTFCDQTSNINQKMEGKFVILSVLIMSLVMAQIQVEAEKICCRNTRARNIFDSYRAQGIPLDFCFKSHWLRKLPS